MKHILFILLLATSLFTTSCASQRALTGNVTAVSAKIDADLKAFNLDESCNGSIKMKRGEAIQISLTKFGIEGARVIMTPDSVLVINKLTKTYLRSSYTEVDKVLGGDGLFNFRNVEAFFWNEANQNTQYATLPVGGFVPLELKTSRSKRVRAGEYNLPQKMDINLSGADGAIETGELKLKFTKIQTANNWTPNTTIPSNYKNLNFVSLVKKMLKK